jgi:predicted Kef-type K+ transport protein
LKDETTANEILTIENKIIQANISQVVRIVENNNKIRKEINKNYYFSIFHVGIFVNIFKTDESIFDWVIEIGVILIFFKPALKLSFNTLLE